MAEPPDEPTPRLDAADRLERVIDAQGTTLDQIDTKSERIARLLGILLGVVLSSLSLPIAGGAGWSVQSGKHLSTEDK